MGKEVERAMIIHRIQPEVEDGERGANRGEIERSDRLEQILAKRHVVLRRKMCLNYRYYELLSMGHKLQP